MKNKIIIFIIIGMLLLPIFITTETHALTSTVFTGTNVYCDSYHARRLVRQSNGTLWCTFDENNDVHITSSEDAGVTWNDREVYGAQFSRYGSLAVDSNDVVHLVFQSLKNDVDDYQLEYTNSNDWTTIVQIRDEDKFHNFPAIAVDSNDNLHIVYHKGEEGGSNDDQVAYINSTDNGGSWGIEQIITNEADFGDDAWYPSIAINSTDGIHVVFKCVDHYDPAPPGGAVYDDILHMQSSDYGATWSDWEDDPVYQDAAHDQESSCIAIDDNDALHVVWKGRDQNVNHQIAYSYNNSSGWTDAEWITWDPARDYLYPSISVNDSDYIHTAYQVEGAGLNHSVNNTISWTEDKVLAGASYLSVNMISTQWPVIDKLKTNRPKTGYAFICSFGSTNITYYASSDLEWDSSQINITNIGNISIVNTTTAAVGVNVNYTLNITNIGYETITNITLNQTWLNCSCSDWNFLLIDTNFNISNITWHNNSCYAIFNISDISPGEYYEFYTVINITECAPNTYGFINTYANVTCDQGVNTSVHSIDWQASIINITKIGNITLVDYINASVGVNVNYTINVSNLGNSALTNIIMNETWHNCACSNWSFNLISTTFNISNITWYNTSCYALFNIPDISIGDYYNFSMIVNITQCAAQIYGFVNNYANVTCDEGVTSSANHNIQWQTLFSTNTLRVIAQRYYTDVQPTVELVFTVLGVLLIVVTIFIVVLMIYRKDRDDREYRY